MDSAIYLFFSNYKTLIIIVLVLYIANLVLTLIHNFVDWFTPFRIKDIESNLKNIKNEMYITRIDQQENYQKILKKLNEIEKDLNTKE